MEVGKREDAQRFGGEMPQDAGPHDCGQKQCDEEEKQQI
jgi:hypothetical protein